MHGRYGGRHAPADQHSSYARPWRGPESVEPPVHAPVASPSMRVHTMREGGRGLDVRSGAMQGRCWGDTGEILRGYGRFAPRPWSPPQLPLRAAGCSYGLRGHVVGSSPPRHAHASRARARVSHVRGRAARRDRYARHTRCRRHRFHRPRSRSSRCDGCTCACASSPGSRSPWRAHRAAQAADRRVWRCRLVRRRGGEPARRQALCPCGRHQYAYAPSHAQGRGGGATRPSGAQGRPGAHARGPPRRDHAPTRGGLDE